MDSTVGCARHVGGRGHTKGAWPCRQTPGMYERSGALRFGVGSVGRLVGGSSFRLPPAAERVHGMLAAAASRLSQPVVVELLGDADEGLVEGERRPGLAGAVVVVA